eukprot:7279939-Alexandrium_andersonii.AAC.1
MRRAIVGCFALYLGYALSFTVRLGTGRSVKFGISKLHALLDYVRCCPSLRHGGPPLALLPSLLSRP